MIKSIWERMVGLESDRERFRQAAMKDYDVEHNKKVKALQEECELEGHEFVCLDSMPGYERTECNKCGLEPEDY